MGDDIKLRVSKIEKSFPGVKALEMEILSATGMAVKMFVLEVDLKDCTCAVR